MRVLVVGATGLIGSAVCARLRADGHEVVGVARSRSAMQSVDRAITLDIAKATSPEEWEGHLDGVNAVVNCAGVFQQGLVESPKGVHVAGIAALFRACENRGIRRVIHFSAIGVDRGAVSEFSRTKLAGDEVLTASGLDWVILRPSVVLGRSAFGASALIRGLASLPFLPVMPATGPLQVVMMDDVVETVVFYLNPEAPSRTILELAGPRKITFEDVVATYRHWLGWAPARRALLPRWVADLAYWSGDVAGWLGWRPPVRSTAKREMARGAVGDPNPWQASTGLHPRDLSATLEREPSSVQERWFSKLYFLKPVIFIVFALFWIATGLISLGPGFDIGVGLMQRAGTGSLAAPGVIAGALADIAIGLAILYRPTARAGLHAALAISLFYLVAGSILVPELWKEPLGPMMKIWPIMALNLVALAILEER
ncbi:SDR family oxidoreductase [Mesorhizobium sp. 1B3]|uniref:SDR family oxidoreductase n=1 Tax=Mesorhizobium sp. 1B3 TaxID=3243599 RepID=UPI003D98AF2A